MINQLDIRLANSNNIVGTVSDSASTGNSVCLVGNFDTVNGFKTNSIALVNSITGKLDSTSSLALALSQLFPSGSLIIRVLYTTSSGHPCFIFIVGPQGINPNRCYVFFTDTLVGYDLLVSSPLAFSSPSTVQMNSSNYCNMKIDTTTGVLVVIGSFYIYPFNGNGCAFINISAMFSGGQNTSVLGVLGGAQITSNTKNFSDLTIDSSTSTLYLMSYPPTLVSVYAIANSASPFTQIYTTNPQINGSVANFFPAYFVAGPGFMTVSNGVLYVGISSGALYIASMDTITRIWKTNPIYVFRNQAFGATYAIGLSSSNNRLYIWGSFTNAMYPQPSGSLTQRVLDTNKRQGIAVFDLNGPTPSILGEDIALSKGVVWLTYYPPPVYNAYEQSAWVNHTHIDTDGAYLFPQITASVYAVSSDHKTATQTFSTNFKNGINYTTMPVKISLHGHDGQLFEANLLY